MKASVPSKKAVSAVRKAYLPCACSLVQGRPSPTETMMHFPPLFQISLLFSKNFQTLRKIFTILPFPEKFLDFSSAEISDDLLFSHQPQISNFPLFSMFQYISPPVSRKLL